jgi:hypothetical protein
MVSQTSSVDGVRNAHRCWNCCHNRFVGNEKVTVRIADTESVTNEAVQIATRISTRHSSLLGCAYLQS